MTCSRRRPNSSRTRLSQIGLWFEQKPPKDFDFDD